MGLEDYVGEIKVAVGDRIDIVNGLWRNIPCQTQFEDVASWDAFFSHYALECKQAVEYEEGEYTTIRKHEDILTIAHDLENGLTKEELEKKLFSLDTQDRQPNVKKRMAEGSIRLAVRIVSMIDIGPISQIHYQGRAPLPWPDSKQNLESVLSSHFTIGHSNPKASRFDQHFNALNLQRYADLEILWTNNLADHLRLVDFESKLCIFHHATFLRGQNSTIFPDNFLKETLLTLALLFPRYDEDIKKWVEHERHTVRDICLDMGLLNCGRLRPEDRHIDQFKYWRDELVALKDLFELPRSTSIKQFWHDDRNKVQWYTFWVAILVLCLTIFFGLVQSIEGAMQVYKAYHPTQG